MKQQASPAQDVDVICSFAERHGLSQDQLRRCLNVIVSPAILDQKCRQSLVRSLFPSELVPPDVVHLAVCSLGLGAKKSSPALQQSLLKWLIMINPVQEDPKGLSPLYHVLFNMLDLIGLRSHLTHLLALITRRRHVQTFRIGFLRRLIAGLPREQGLEKLSYAYEYFVPGSFALPKGKLFVSFAHPDPMWAARLKDIQAQQTANSLIGGSLSMPFEVLLGGMSAAMSNSAGDLVHQSDLRDAGQVVQAIAKDHNLTMTVSDLQSPLLRELLILSPNDNMEVHMSEMLSDVLGRQLDKVAEGDDLETDILERILIYSQQTKVNYPKSSCCQCMVTEILQVLLQEVQNFMKDYLVRWDGHQQQQTILELLSYLPITNFQGKLCLLGHIHSRSRSLSAEVLDLQSSHLNRLESALLSQSAPTSQSTVLTFYTSLLRNWTTQLLAQNTPPTSQQQTSIIDLIEHTSILMLTMLHCFPLSRPPDPGSTNAVLSHLEAQVTLVQPPNFLAIPPPSPLLVHTLLFSSPDLSTLQSVCSLLARYKQAFEPSPSSSTSGPPNPTPGQATSSPSKRPESHTQPLNTSLTDTCNLLFRSRGFITTDTYSQGCLLPESTKQNLDEYITSTLPALTSTGSNSLSTWFGMSYHPALSNISNIAFTDFESRQHRERRQRLGTGPEYGNGGGAMDIDNVNTDQQGKVHGQQEQEQEQEQEQVKHEGPITPRSLALLARDGGVKISWKEYRVLILRWLESMGVNGLSELAKATMKGLGLDSELG